MWIDIWKKVVNIFLHATLNGSRALRLFLGLWPCAEAIATLFGQLCLEARKNRMQDKQATCKLGCIKITARCCNCLAVTRKMVKTYNWHLVCNISKIKLKPENRKRNWNKFSLYARVCLSPHLAGNGAVRRSTYIKWLHIAICKVAWIVASIAIQKWMRALTQMKVNRLKRNNTWL